MPAVEPVTNACLPARPKPMTSSHPSSGRRPDNGRTLLGNTGRPPMRKMIGLLMAAAVLAAGAADAQTVLKPGTPSILHWTLEQQTEWYPAIETVYRTETVK